MIPILFAAALAACVAPADQAGPLVPAATDAAQRGDLAGEWVVARLGDETLEQPIALAGDAGSLVWQPACAGQTISYEVTGRTAQFRRPRHDGAQIVCQIAYPQALPRVLDALEGRWTMSETPDGGVQLVRGGERITLEPARTEAPVTLAGEWRVAGIDGEPFDEPYGIALSADGNEIWWAPRCAGQSVRYTIRGDRFTAQPERAPGAICKIGLPGRLPEVMTALRAAERIERTPANGLRLLGKGRSLTLFSQ